MASDVLLIADDEREAIWAYWHSMALLGTGQPILAVESFRKAIELKADYPEPYLGLATALVASNPLDPAAATVAIKKYFALNPKNPEAKSYRLLGDLFKQNGEVEASRDAFRRADKIELASDGHSKTSDAN